MFKRLFVVFWLVSVSSMAWSGPDPMRPAGLGKSPVAAKPAFESDHWRLNLIRQAGDVRVALLNDRLVNVGGRVDGALVTAIDAHQVILRLPDLSSIKLRLPSTQLGRQAKH